MGSYGLYLIMGAAGLISSTVVSSTLSPAGACVPGVVVQSSPGTSGVHLTATPWLLVGNTVGFL